ncbi:hypothetical protein MPH_05309 [Macrophomina phaseolina MS6]|uniref:Uncharacterized protein n=1 Tax=Macrophomina phaseolina (strain MS6) TaxID=1126212 RepID=K2SL13_MACPH|nr:hypothetical protein MPH_05309 [Macrophomina phaseolina MS6]
MRFRYGTRWEEREKGVPFTALPSARIGRFRWMILARWSTQADEEAEWLKTSKSLHLTNYGLVDLPAAGRNLSGSDSLVFGSLLRLIFGTGSSNGRRRCN